MSGRRVRIKRGPYKKQALPRSAIRLLAYLRVITGKSKTGWADIDLGEISRYLDLSRTTVQRSKNLLDSKKLLLFRSISNVSGRKGHFLLVGNPEKVKQEIHSKDVFGKVRHRWIRVGQQRLTSSTIIPTTPVGVIPVQNRMRAVVQHSGVLNQGIPRNCPQNQAVTRGQNQVSNFNPHTMGIGISQKDTPLRGCSKGWAGTSGTISPRQVKLGHWVKRQLLEKWWENCKVEIPNNQGQIYNFAIRWISKGICTIQIEKAFELALQKMHGVATDVGLLTGDQFLKFNVSSTVVAADRILTKLFWDGKLTFYRN